MEAKKVKILAVATAASLLIMVAIILWHYLGISKTFFILASIDLAVIFAIFVWLILQCAIVDQRQASIVRRPVLEGEELRLQYSFLRKVAGLPTKFRYEALEVATDNFQALIGRGSSASVFKGILDGIPIAVKRIEGAEHGDREFRSEVTAIANVQHVNLVHLLGYCLVPRSSTRFLVYEFVCNGSLDNWIFPRKKSSKSDPPKCLPWPVRYRVAVDVAKALAYLHHDCRARVLHLDVKPENILLDESFRALVSDFGLSKLMGKDESRIVMSVRGTRGYLAPEWFMGGGVSERCDIFSYGMVLLELVGGRRSVRLAGDAAQREWSYFPRIVMDKMSQGKVMEVVDERLIRSGVQETEVRTMVYVALWCIREEAKLRPSMAQVVDMLQGRMAVEAPPPEPEMLILDLLNMEHISPAANPEGGTASSGGLHQLDSDTPVASTPLSAITILSGR